MKQSAGLLLYRNQNGLEVFLVHPGGPYWEKKDEGSWSLPKGEYLKGEDPFEAAKREFQEETSFPPPEGGYIALGELQTTSSKIVTAWAVQGGCPAEICSNLFIMEWPPRSGKMQEFPECDRAGWFSVEDAKVKIASGQRGFLDRFCLTQHSIK
jgi:predicted NUDIX family NTP pyrophosphohydrolase